MTEKRKIYLSNWRKENRNRINKYYRKYYDLHKENWKYHKSKNFEYFKKSNPISINCIRRHGMNAIRVYIKYKGRCATCGRDWDLTIHHIDGKGRNYIEKGLNPNNSLKNLILLCRKCHGSIHGKQNKGRKGKSN